MNTLNQNTSKNLNLKNPVFRQKFIIFLYCLVISAATWIIIKFSKDNTINLPIAYAITDIPDNVFIKSLSDSTLLLSLKTSAFKLYLSPRYSQNQNINIEYSRIQRMMRQGNEVHYFTTVGIGNRLAASLDIARPMLEIIPDTVFIEVSRAYSKKVPLIFKGHLDFAPQHQLYEPMKLSADSISLRGPRQILEGISVLYTDSVQLNQLSESTSIQLNVAAPFSQKSIIISPKTVTAQIQVEKFTEAVVEIPITAVISADTHFSKDDIRLFPEKVRITCRVALKDFKKVNTEWFQAVVYYPGAEKQSNALLKVEVTAFPAFTSIVRFEPEWVEYVIVKQ